MPNESNVPETGLAAHEVDIMRAVEDELWWYRALRHQVLETIGNARRDFTLLDAGCGSGGMLARVHERFPSASLVGLDVSERALASTRARHTSAELVAGRVDALPLSDSLFDVVLSLDVLTVRGVDDRRAMSEMFRVLRPNGRLILNLPAFEFLRGSHDIAVNQVRRVRRGDILPLLREVGFTIEKCTYWNMLLTPLIAAVRLTSRRQTSNIRSDLKPVSPPLNSLLTCITKAELALSRIAPLPFGTSLFVVARK